MTHAPIDSIKRIHAIEHNRLFFIDPYHPIVIVTVFVIAGDDGVDELVVEPAVPSLLLSCVLSFVLLVLLLEVLGQSRDSLMRFNAPQVQCDPIGVRSMRFSSVQFALGKLQDETICCSLCRSIKDNPPRYFPVFFFSLSLLLAPSLSSLFFPLVPFRLFPPLFFFNTNTKGERKREQQPKPPHCRFNVVVAVFFFLSRSCVYTHTHKCPFLSFRSLDAPVVPWFCVLRS